MKRIAMSALAVGVFSAPAAAQVQTDQIQLGTIDVQAAGEAPKAAVTLETNGLPAKTTVINRQTIERTNVGGDYTDLLRRVPGVNAYNFGQGDIGSPIKMRGFTGTGAHGGDVAIYVDGAPQNFPSANQGGPGMSDLSWLSPEAIERIEVVKGPFSALYGDQNRAGAINIITRNSGDNSVGVSAGSYGRKRGSLTHSYSKDNLSTFIAGELYDIDGYRDNSALTRGNLFAKASVRAGDAIWALRGHYYKSEWDAPGYLNYNALVAGRVNGRDRDPGAPPLWGEAERYGLVLTHAPAKGEEGLHATAYAERYMKKRANGAGVNSYNVQNDDRGIVGARAVYNIVFSPRAALAVGGEVRSDRGTGFNQRWDTPAGPGKNYVNYWDLDLLTYGVFAQGQYALLDSLKLVGGLRADYFDYRIDNKKLPAASLDYDGSATSPRIGLVWSPIKELEIFANIGEGFRSPAERELSPAGGLGPLGAAGGAAAPGLKPPKVEARDIGFNAFLGRQWKVSASYYETLNKNEIRETTPGSGVYAGIGDTKRDGWEIEATFFATDALSFYGSFGKVKGRIVNPAVAGQNMISGLPEDMFRLGVEYVTSLMDGELVLNGDAFFMSVAPYYSGNSLLYSERYTRYDVRASYDLGALRYTLFGTFQPNKYASEQAGATIDPRPRADIGAAIRYTF